MITIFGWYGRGNLGDEAFKSAFGSMFAGSEFRFISNNDEVPKDDILILGAGDVVKSFYLNKIQSDRPYYALGVGCAYPDDISLLGKNCQGVYFRNQADFKAAQAMGMNAFLCPDIAFSLPVQASPEKDPIAQVGKKKLAVILSNSVIQPGISSDQMGDVSYQEYMKWELAKALDYLSEFYHVNFIPLSHERFAYDIGMHYDVSSRMEKGMDQLIWDQPIDPYQALSGIKDYDLVITMKFHGMIFATMMGIPFVNVGLTRKTTMFCQDNGLSDLMIDPYSLTKDKLIDAVKRAEVQGVRDRLLAVTETSRQSLASVASQIKSTWLK